MPPDACGFLRQQCPQPPTLRHLNFRKRFFTRLPAVGAGDSLKNMMKGKDMAKRTVARITINAPFTIWFTFVCVGAYISALVTGGWSMVHIFSIGDGFSWSNPIAYPRLFLHTVGHASVQHLTFNLALILLIGPMLEEKYGAIRLLLVSAITALVTAACMLLFFNGLLLGASGIAFAFIILASFGGARSGTIPLTFILVASIYLGREIYMAFGPEDSIARFAHIIGGCAGGVFGFRWLGRRL